ncbi:MAG: caspase family protein, partial [Bacteroidota bacterium]
IVSLAFQEDGWVFSAGGDRTVVISEAASGNELAKISDMSEDITGMALASSGKYFAVGNYMGTIQIYAVAQQTKMQTLTDAKEKISILSYTSDGKLLIAGTALGGLYVWDAQTYLLKAKWNDQKGKILSATVDPQTRWLVTAASDSTIHFYDLAKQTPMRFMKGQGCVPSSVTFVNDEMLIVGTSKGTIERWKVSMTPPDTTPPTLVISQPGNTTEQAPMKFFGDVQTVSGFAYDDSGIKELSINGMPIKFDSFTPPDSLKIPASMKSVKFSANMKLDAPGLNVFQIVTKDLFGHVTQGKCCIFKLGKDQALEIVMPSDNAETDLVSIPIRFRAWFDISNYSISANMTDIISGQEPSLSVSKNAIDETVPLLVGYNQIQLTVVDKSGNQYVKTLGVTRKANMTYNTPAPSSSPQKSRGAASGPQHWAVVVGISEYQNPGIPSLKYADKDAEAIADFLRKPEGGGYDSDHLRVLLNKDATLSGVKDALINFLSQAIDMDLVMIYFAGHGAPEPSRPQNVYLLTTDSDPNALGTTAFPMWDIQTVLARYINAKRVVVFTDACHSGNISADFATRGLSSTEDNLVNQSLTDLSKTKPGIVVFTASAAGEVSQEYPEFGHGVFTYYMLEGLEGKADYNNDYTVTINELMQYVEEQVKRKTHGAQNPTRSQTEYDKEMTISILPH